MENIYANAGKVISGERYVTRGGIEEKIKNRVLAGQATGSFSIMGMQRTGKSSILANIFVKNSSALLQKRRIVVDISLSSINKPENLFTEIVGRSFGKIRRREEAEDLKYLEESYEEAMAWNLERGSMRELQDYMEELAALDYHVIAVVLQLVITGSESLGEYISRGGGKNLLPDKLPYLPREAVIRLLEEPIRKIDGSSRYEKEPQVLSGVYELTKGNPILTQAIAYSLVNKLNERGQEDVTGELLAEVVDEIVRENHNTWRARFSPLMNCETAKGRWEEADVTELCKGLERAKEEGDDALEAFLQGLSEKEREVYTALKERDVIKLDEKMLPYVEVSLFGKWCRYE